MAVGYNPRIVTDGLVLCLDAGNTKSYNTGISTTVWNDVSGRRNNTTLTNGPTFDSANGGSILFDGTNDYVDFFAPDLTTTATVDMWIKASSFSSNDMFFGWLQYDVITLTGSFGYNTNNSDIFGIPAATVTSLGLLNTWAHYVFEMRSDVAYTNNKIYINGVSQSLSQVLGLESAANRTFNSGNGRIAGWRNADTFFMPMNCSVFKVYNRALTQAEILQNFNATRGRYGI